MPHAASTPSCPPLPCFLGCRRITLSKLTGGNGKRGTKTSAVDDMIGFYVLRASDATGARVKVLVLPGRVGGRHLRTCRAMRHPEVHCRDWVTGFGHCPRTEVTHAAPSCAPR